MWSSLSFLSTVIPAKAGIHRRASARHKTQEIFHLTRYLTFALAVVVAVLFFTSPSQAAAESSQISTAFCQALVKHIPDADVAYQPGVDVNGNPVVPADLLGQPQIKLPEKIEIPLTLNLAKAINLSTTSYPASQFGAGTEMKLGTLLVEGDKVLFNGKPLTSDEQDRLSVLCMKPR